MSVITGEAILGLSTGSMDVAGLAVFSLFVAASVWLLVAVLMSMRRTILIGMVAIATRNLLDRHTTIPARDAPHAVQKENQDSPERDELKTPLGKMIVTRSRFVAPLAESRGARPRLDVHFDAFLIAAEAGVSVDEPPITIAVV